MTWLSRLKLALGRKPAAKPSPTACPQCQAQMKFVEKYTMGGEDLRTYACDRCQQEHTLYFGVAMWKLMSDANKPDAET
jgi:hypothetical protein